MPDSTSAPHGWENTHDKIVAEETGRVEMPPDPFTPIEVKVYDLRVPVATAVIAFAVGYFIGRFIEWVDNG
jgi:hypothetical protein